MPTAAKQSYPLPTSPKLSSTILIRHATPTDTAALATCFFTAWTPSHAFWETKWKPDPFYPWFITAFTKEFKPDTTYVTYVAIDTAIEPDNSEENKSLPPWEQRGANTHDGRLVAFTRWRVPQADGNLDEGWPDLAEEKLDMEVMGAFFEGMEVNHSAMMGSRPHWFLQLLGTETGYQRMGIGGMFVRWGVERADEEGLECYVDASEFGAPLYKRFGFGDARIIHVPKREEYGEYEYASYWRPRGGEVKVEG